MSEIIMKPIGYVKTKRTETVDDNWGQYESIIKLCPEYSESCFDGIEDFSHLEIIFYFHKSNKTFIGSEYPRENIKYPKIGIFAQRKKDRPNHIGATIVKLDKRIDNKIIVKNFDAINGTPVLDIKPVFIEYLPNEKIEQSEWSKDLMKNYW